MNVRQLRRILDGLPPDTELLVELGGCETSFPVQLCLLEPAAEPGRCTVHFVAGPAEGGPCTLLGGKNTGGEGSSAALPGLSWLSPQQVRELISDTVRSLLAEVPPPTAPVSTRSINPASPGRRAC